MLLRTITSECLISLWSIFEYTYVVPRLEYTSDVLGYLPVSCLSSMRVTALSFLCLFICYGRSTSKLSTEEKQEALDFHNDLRRSEGASNMLSMVTLMRIELQSNVLYLQC